METHARDAARSVTANRWVAGLLSHQLRALVQKELNQIRRDRRVIAALVMPPILQLMLFGSVMSPAVGNIRLGIVDHSQSAASRDLVAALAESGTFELAQAYPSAERLGDDVSVARIDVGVVIPADFARDLDRGRSTTIQVLLNAMNANTASISRGYIQGVVQDFNETRERPVRASVTRLPGDARQGAVRLSPALLYNPGGETTWFIVTGLLGTLLLMNGAMTASTTMVKEREAGTLEQLLMTPSGMTEIIVAKIVPPFVLLAVPATLALVVIRFYFGVPFSGSAPLIVLACALCLLCGIGIGTAMATLTKSAAQAQLATFFVTPPLMSLSGALAPAEAMPAWMQPLTVLNPVYHFGVISRAALIKGSGLAELWPHLLGLLVFALALMSVSVWRFRQQLS
jgi:ABC-2 type transport system permease protein